MAERCASDGRRAFKTPCGLELCDDCNFAHLEVCQECSADYDTAMVIELLRWLN